MSSKKSVFLAILFFSLLMLGVSRGIAQNNPSNPNNPLAVTGSLPRTPLPPPATTGPIELQSVPVSPQSPPRTSVPPSEANQFEHHSSFLSLPRIFAHQWSPTTEIAPENVISERYMRSEDPNARGLTLKEAIYIALQNNPNLKATELDPRDVGAATNLGIAFSFHGEFDQAIASFHRVLELDPKYAPAHANLGIALYAQRKLDQAIASFRRTIELDPKNAIAGVNLGIALHEQGKLDESITVLRKVTETDPSDAEAHTYLGSTLQDNGEFERALASHRRAIELDPKLSFAHRNLGTTLVALGRLDEAIASYRRALELDPRDGIALERLGIALRKQANPDAAIECFERALELNPLSGPITLNLGTCFVDKGDLELALVQFRKAEQLFAQDPSLQGRDWLERSRDYIARAKQNLERRAPSNEVLDGRSAGSTEEWNAAVRYGYDHHRHREVVTLTEVTLRDAPELIDELGTYGSACSAALLAAEPDADVSEDERLRVRELARAWLNRVVEKWMAQRGQSGVPGTTARDGLERALADPDFASVRAEAIENLPEGERAAWRALWKRIETGTAQ